jgi:hypothetical protein
MADEKNMPDVARRRGGADTLFSAEWFDDNDEFTGTKPEGARENVAIPSGTSAPAEAPAVAAAVAEKPASSGPPMVLVVAGLAVVFLGGGCAVGAVGAGAAFALGLVPF